MGFPRSTETIVSLSLGLDGDTADAEDYSTDLSSAAFLVIPAGETRSTGGTPHSSIMLTLVQDDIDESDESFTLTAVDNAAVLAGTSTVFTILDDDTRRVIVTPEALTVPEGGGRRNYTVRLASQPVGGDVTVKITGVTRADEDEEQGRTLNFFQDSAGDAKVTSADDLLFAPVGEGVVLTFTAANWFEEQAVYVELPSNDVVQDDSEATIEHSVSDGDYADETVPDVVLKLTEFGFFVSVPTPATVSEGESAEYSIRLTSEPEDTVMVTVVLPSNPSIGFFLTTPEVLSFSTENWHETQPVIVEYEDDEWSNGDHILEITHTAESEDANYDSGGVSEVSVRLNFRDDEDLPLLRLVLSQDRAVEGTTGMSEESPLEMTVTAGFVGSPRSTETIVSLSFGLNDSADAADYSTDLAPDAFLVIPAEATSSPVGAQHSTFILTLVQDPIDEGEAESFTLRAVDDAGILAEAAAAFTILDDDSAGIVVTPGEPRRLRKGQTAEYSVVLTSQPTGEVMVSVNAVASVDAVGVVDSDVLPSDVFISSPPLLFAAHNWSVPQAVTVTAIAIVDSMDDDPNFGEVEIKFSVVSPDSKYSGIEETRTLEIIDVNATLSRLQLMAGGGEEIVLTNPADGSTGFMPDNMEYSAAIPVDVDEVRYHGRAECHPDGHDG